MVTVEMKDLADVGPVGDEIFACYVDVRDDEEHALRRARYAGCGQMDRAWRSGRGQLHCAKVLPDHEIGVESPSQVLVERFGAIDVGNRDGDDLQLQIDGRGARGVG